MWLIDKLKSRKQNKVARKDRKTKGRNSSGGKASKAASSSKANVTTKPQEAVVEQQYRPGEWCYHENVRCAIRDWVLDDNENVVELVLAPEKEQNSPKTVKVKDVKPDDRFIVNENKEIAETEGK